MKIQEKLLDIFLKSTSNIRNKRNVEWALHDIYEVLYILFILSGFYAIVTWSGWALLFAALIWFFLLFCWNVFSYHARKLLLGHLYPEGETAEEMQEIQLDNLFKQVDNLIKELNE